MISTDHLIVSFFINHLLSYKSTHIRTRRHMSCVSVCVKLQTILAARIIIQMYRMFWVFGQWTSSFKYFGFFFVVCLFFSFSPFAHRKHQRNHFLCHLDWNYGVIYSIIVVISIGNKSPHTKSDLLKIQVKGKTRVKRRCEKEVGETKEKDKESECSPNKRKKLASAWEIEKNRLKFQIVSMSNNRKREKEREKNTAAEEEKYIQNKNEQHNQQQEHLQCVSCICLRIVS